MTWLIEDAQFDLVVDQSGTWFSGFKNRHEWLAYGEAVSDREIARLHSLPLQWEIRSSGAGYVKRYLEVGGGSALEGAKTAVRVPNDAVIVIAEVDPSTWSNLLGAFQDFSAATYPKHFRINVPFESLSTRKGPTVALGQFLTGDLPNASSEEVSVVFRFGVELPEARA